MYHDTVPTKMVPSSSMSVHKTRDFSCKENNNIDDNLIGHMTITKHSLTLLKRAIKITPTKIKGYQTNIFTVSTEGQRFDIISYFPMSL